MRISAARTSALRMPFLKKQITGSNCKFFLASEKKLYDIRATHEHLAHVLRVNLQSQHFSHCLKQFTIENMYTKKIEFIILVRFFFKKFAHECLARAFRVQAGCVAVCCSVLQCVAVCCSVLQCVAVPCSVLQCLARAFSARAGCVAVCCRSLQCVVMCCSVLQCVAVHCYPDGARQRRHGAPRRRAPKIGHPMGLHHSVLSSVITDNILTRLFFCPHT